VAVFATQAVDDVHEERKAASLDGKTPSNLITFFKPEHSSSREDSFHPTSTTVMNSNRNDLACNHAVAKVHLPL
jgi:hypothetical protein